MLILCQKSCFLGPTIFEIPQPNWYFCAMEVFRKFHSNIFYTSSTPYIVSYKKFPWFPDGTCKIFISLVLNNFCSIEALTPTLPAKIADVFYGQPFSRKPSQVNDLRLRLSCCWLSKHFFSRCVNAIHFEVQKEFPVIEF